MKRILICSLFLASAVGALAQSNLPPASAVGTMLTLNAPAVCVTGNTCAAQAFICKGAASACSLTAAVWSPIGAPVTGLVAGTPGSFTDNSQPVGAAVTYTVEYTQGSVNGGPLPTYTGTPAPPLAGGSFSGSTS